MWGHQRKTRADNDCLTIILGRSCSNKSYHTILNLSNQQSLRKFWWRNKRSLMFYIMTRTDLLTFSSNQTWETWTSWNPLRKKRVGVQVQNYSAKKKSVNNDEHNLNCTHFKTFVARQPIIASRSLWYQVKVTIRYHQGENICWSASWTSAFNQAVNTHILNSEEMEGHSPLALETLECLSLLWHLGESPNPEITPNNAVQSFLSFDHKSSQSRQEYWFHRGFICCLSLPADPVVHRDL